MRDRTIATNTTNLSEQQNVDWQFALIIERSYPPAEYAALIVRCKTWIRFYDAFPGAEVEA